MHSVEPVFFHALPIETDREWHHSYDLVGVVSLTAGAGNDAIACLMQRKPWCGVVLSQKRAEALQEWLYRQVWKAMCTESSGLYESELASLVKDAEVAVDTVPKPRAKSRPGPPAHMWTLPVSHGLHPHVSR